MQLPNYQNNEFITYVGESKIHALFWRIIRAMGAGDFNKGRRRLISVYSDEHAFVQAVTDAALQVSSDMTSGKAEDLKGAKFGGATNIAELFFNLMSASPGITVATLTMAHWYDHATNVVQLSHKMAASFLLSSYEGALSDIKLPFKSFMIEVPNDLIVLPEGSVKRIIVGEYIANDNQQAHGSPGYSYTYDVGTGNVWNVESTIPKLLSSEMNMVNPEIGATEIDFELDDDDKRITVLVKRLIAGVCLYMANDGPVKSKQRSQKKSKSRVVRGVQGAPEQRIFTLTQSIEHNFIQEVKDFAAGRRKSTQTVQYIVRGHWRNQACGPGLKDRKRLWVQPFWKGDENALIAKRAHKIK